MGIAARLLALVGVKAPEGETDEQTLSRLDALTASLGDEVLARQAFLDGKTAPQVVAAIREELAGAKAALVSEQAATVKLSAELTEARALASKAGELQAALDAERAKVKALAPGLATNTAAAAASNAATPTGTAAEYEAAVAAEQAKGCDRNTAAARVATARPDLLAAYNAAQSAKIRN